MIYIFIFLFFYTTDFFKHKKKRIISNKNQIGLDLNELFIYINELKKKKDCSKFHYVFFFFKKEKKKNFLVYKKE